MSTYDPNIFYESQLNNKAVTWELLAQPWSAEGKRVQAEAQWTDVVLRGIISDTEFSVSGSHDFSQPDGLVGDVASKVQGWANQLTQLAQTSKSIEGFTNTLFGNGTVGNLKDKAVEGFGGSSSLGGKIINSIYDNGGSVFRTSFDFVKVFKGTGLEINFPSLDTRIYNGTFVKDGKILTSKEYLSQVFSRFIGDLKDSGSAALDNILGVQQAPNDYVPSFDDVRANSIVQGSFMLRYGSYEIPNLLVSGFSAKASTFRVREGSNSGSLLPSDCKETDEPLYVDISINVMPCTYVSRDLLMKIMKLNPLPE